MHHSFSQSTSLDRHYLVRIGGVFEKIGFSGGLVRGLMEFNAPGLREDRSLDKCFIKGLLIGICTMKSIRENENIHKDIMKFIKGIQICDCSQVSFS